MIARFDYSGTYSVIVLLLQRGITENNEQPIERTTSIRITAFGLLENDACRFLGLADSLREETFTGSVNRVHIRPGDAAAWYPAKIFFQIHGYCNCDWALLRDMLERFLFSDMDGIEYQAVSLTIWQIARHYDPMDSRLLATMQRKFVVSQP
jgi:hypothetical protein